MSKFEDDVKKFNKMYDMPDMLTTRSPSLWHCRLKQFRDILFEEFLELDDVLRRLYGAEADGYKTDIECLTELADFLGDMQVYCASEMVKFGIPVDGTLSLIMESNFSKLTADGSVIKDARGKVMKGPGYWKPEPAIKDLLETIHKPKGKE